jgi:pimeloyl-ACP methyl ester carboxylesterase
LTRGEHPVAILLPGLDGTAELFAPFVAAAPVGHTVRPLRLPSDRPRGYRELADHVRAQLPAGPVALIAESFSGPLAVLLADQCRSIVALVLCASYVDPPLPSLVARLPRSVWRRPPPAALLRLCLTGGDRRLAEAVRRAVASVGADVMAGRIAETLRVDVTRELGRLAQPILYLRATRDRMIRARSAERIRALKPSTCIVEIDAPHLLLQTNPTDAWRHIEPFLDQAMVAAGGAAGAREQGGNRRVDWPAQQQ